MKSRPTTDPGTDPQRLLRIVESFAGRRVAVLGDLVCDEFVYGDIERVSREAPVLILEHQRTVVVPGGGGNSVVNLSSLGATVLPVGVVGKDVAGRGLLEAFARLGISTSGIAVVAGYSTPCKSRVLAGGVHTRRQQIVRLDRGSKRGELPSRTAARVQRSLTAALRRADGLLVADYGYGAATPEAVQGAWASVERKDFVFTVDSRSRATRFTQATASTPNQEELERALGLAGLDESGLVSAGRRYLRRSAHRAVLITRGARGMTLVERGRPAVHIPPYGSDEVADVTGAGDTVIASFTLGLLAGADAADAARIANYAAGIVVTKSGTATVSAEELERAIREDHER